MANTANCLATSVSTTAPRGVSIATATRDGWWLESFRSKSHSWATPAPLCSTVLRSITRRSASNTQTSWLSAAQSIPTNNSNRSDTTLPSWPHPQCLISPVLALCAQTPYGTCIRDRTGGAHVRFRRYIAGEQWPSRRCDRSPPGFPVRLNLKGTGEPTDRLDLRNTAPVLDPTARARSDG